MFNIGFEQSTYIDEKNTQKVPIVWAPGHHVSVKTMDQLPSHNYETPDYLVRK